MNKIELHPLALSEEETFIKEIQIAFDKAGTKKLMAKFAKLKKI